MKKIQIGKRLYNVVDPKDYNDNQSIYNPRFTALEIHKNNEEYVLPINSRSTDISPGVYVPVDGMVNVINKPDDKEEYSTDKIIDYKKAKDIGDIFKNNQLIRDIQSDIIATSENILHLNIGEQDTQSMAALKNAINSKGIDKKQYEDRFEQFQNDMRLLKGNSITLGKLVSICKAFDIAAELTLKDKDDAPNPMGQEFTVDLTEDRGGDNK